MIEEIWKPIEGTDGGYEVSNLGRVRSMKMYRGATGRIMPHTKQHHGYHAVMFHINGKAQCRKVHRLVAEAFIPNPNKLTDVNHKDGNKDNNQVSNLEWVTPDENKRRAKAMGLLKPRKLTDEEKNKIKERAKSGTKDED